MLMIYMFSEQFSILLGSMDKYSENRTSEFKEDVYKPEFKKLILN